MASENNGSVCRVCVEAQQPFTIISASARAVLVRKKLSAKEGGGWLSGTLFCTHFRVAFVPQDSQKPDDNADPVLLGDHDVALASIDKVVAVGPSRTKLVTPTCSLKFTPEELVLYCRDMRVLCFLFDRLTPDTQASTSSAAGKLSLQLSGGFAHKPNLVTNPNIQCFSTRSIEMKQFLSNRRRDPNMNWFECSMGWEQELERTGASGWRVSSVNDRFEMSTSLPRFNVVPQRVLDTELKKTFAHFNEGRIPRWCWRHPHGSDLLRMASFQNNIYHEKDDIRNLELVLFGGQQLCVIVDLGEEMPSPADIQLAHTRLRTLCLGDISSSVSVPDDKWLSTLESTRWLDYTRCCLRKAAEVACLLRGGHMTVVLQEPEDRDMNCVVCSLVQAPVFLLFLDCVWQLWAQYPARFQLTEDYLLTLHDSVHLPLFSSFLANSQRERCRRSQSYTPVNGLRELPIGAPEEPVDPPFPPVWDWALQYSSQRRARFTQPVSQPACPPPHNDGLPGSVFLLSRSTFSHPSNLLPWRSGNSGSYWKSHRRAPSSESLSGLERLIRACSLSEPSENPSTLHDPYEPLLPLLLGPCVRVWRGCYLRGALHAQAFSHPTSSCNQHPLDQLAWEVQQLREKLAQAYHRRPENQTKRQEPRRLESNLNQNANNGTFLFSSSSRTSQQQLPPSSRGAAHSSVPPRAQRTASDPPRPAQRNNGKHTFLFGHQEPQSGQRYVPSPSAKPQKRAGNSH
ncbi:Myotubularin-related protein 11 [Labeo rohita]|uniref:Myotubularin-related protein 11 n=1 Tax=Labeo rohita TaxID=84645 RepID=A0ABQ8LYB0_LABRO|nr:Myotubularin-related protein 11 [Labeo rohita]